jgi:hypothetical protein
MGMVQLLISLKNGKKQTVAYGISTTTIRKTEWENNSKDDMKLVL